MGVGVGVEKRGGVAGRDWLWVWVCCARVLVCCVADGALSVDRCGGAQGSSLCADMVVVAVAVGANV
eukprot:scaffold194513_cov13-Tisochrysis_lutea.AAC.1